MTMFDDPNRECVGLTPIWGDETGDNVTNATGATAGIPGAWTPAGADPPEDAAQATQWGVTASPATPWTTGQHVQGRLAGAPGEMTWTGSAWVGGRAPLAAGIDPAAHTVDDVYTYATAHPDEAAAILAAERAGKNRVTLTEALEAL